MALFKFQNNNKHGNLRTRIVHSPTSQFSFKPKGLGKFVNVQRFYYEMEHEYLTPILFNDQNGDRIMMPDGIKVHPKTTLNDTKPTLNDIKPILNHTKLYRIRWLRHL